MAPRGIVAAATASTFGATLAASHVGGASKILPVTFLVIVATVALYGLTAVPVARARRHPPRPHPPAAGRQRPVGPGPGPRLPGGPLDVLMWAPSGASVARSAQAGLELVLAERPSSPVGEDAELEGVTAILLLTGEDHLNALAATTLADNADTPVYRLAPSHGAVAPYTPGEPPSPSPSPARP